MIIFPPGGLPQQNNYRSSGSAIVNSKKLLRPKKDNDYYDNLYHNLVDEGSFQ